MFCWNKVKFICFEMSHIRWYINIYGKETPDQMIDLHRFDLGTTAKGSFSHNTCLYIVFRLYIKMIFTAYNIWKLFSFLHVLFVFIVMFILFVCFCWVFFFSDIHFWDLASYFGWAKYYLWHRIYYRKKNCLNNIFVLWQNIIIIYILFTL